MNRPWLLWIPLAVVAFIGGLAMYGLAVPKDEQVHSAMIGQKLPAFSLPAATAGVEGLASADTQIELSKATASRLQESRGRVRILLKGEGVSLKHQARV